MKGEIGEGYFKRDGKLNYLRTLLELYLVEADDWDHLNSTYHANRVYYGGRMKDIRPDIRMMYIRFNTLCGTIVTALASKPERRKKKMQRLARESGSFPDGHLREWLVQIGKRVEEWK